MDMDYTFILIIIGALAVTFLIMKFMARRAAAHSLKSEIKSLERENAKHVRENIVLQQELSKKTQNDEMRLLEYPFDYKTGIRRHKLTGVPYCNTCMIEKGLKSPLKVETDGWYCPICQTFVKSDTTNYDTGF